jgi:DNA ligase (NAD+)
MIKSASKFFALALGKKSDRGVKFHPSEKCPECGTPLMSVNRKVESQETQTYARLPAEGEVSVRSSLRDGDANWCCPNLDCPAQIRARIEHWCSPAAMDIPVGDKAFVAVLVSHGLIRDVAELYRLKVGEIAGLPGMSRDSAQAFWDAIAASKKRDAWRVLFGLGIPQLSTEQAKSLCRHFATVDNVLDSNVERLQKAKGVSEITARSIVDWHNDNLNRKLVKGLFKRGVNFESQF